MRKLPFSDLESIPKDKIFRKNMKLSIQLIQIVYISFDIICSQCLEVFSVGSSKCQFCLIENGPTSLRCKVIILFI